MFKILLAATLAAAPQTQLDTTLAVRPGDRLEIENLHGATVIRGWDRNQLRIRARADASSRIEIDRFGSAVRVERSGRGPGSVDYEIDVPHSFDIEVGAQHGAVEVADVEGDINVESVFGAITLNAVAGRTRAEAVHGEITASDTRGELELTNSNGSIRATGHDGDLNVEGLNGDIELTAVRSIAVYVETVNGSVRFTGEIRDDGRYHLETHNGSVMITVPEGANATVSVETFLGEVESDFPVQLRSGVGREGVTFTIGNGNARIELASFGGSIEIRRGAGR